MALPTPRLIISSFATCILKLVRPVLMGTNIFNIIVSLQRIDPFIVMEYLSLSLIIFFALKSALPDVNMATLALLCLVFAWFISWTFLLSTLYL